jgi:hypothetical protein
MTFPTIPTVASGDLLSSTTSPASTTHTFPNLSSLRGGAGPQVGDLLIAICVQYGAATAGNQYSSWGASFLEILDDALASGTGVGAIGVAYKIAVGGESGTFNVTSATSSKSVQFLMRIPAATWRGTTIPEILAAIRATGLAADPGSFDPTNWGAEDTLWIAIAGQTETSTTGSPPTLDSPPANYSGQLIVARVADAVGDITAGVAFRQLNASAENVGVWTGTNLNRGNGIATVIAIRPPPATLFGAIALPITFGKAIAGIVLPQSTPVAEISLPDGGTPSEQTNHSIKIRARTTSGSTGVIKAALYEGTTNRSGDLISDPLTNSLVDYTLAIPDASAANITDYSNLSIKIWGYAPNGGSLVFEVADIYLELPESTGPATLYGVIDRSFIFGKAVSATKQTFGQVATSFTFGKAVSGVRTAFGQIVAPFTFTKVVSGIRTAFGQIVAPFTFIKDVSGKKETFGQVVAPFIFTKDVNGVRTAFGQIAFDITNSIVTSGIRVANTLFGIVDFPITFIKDVLAKKETFGQVVAPFTFVKAVSGVKTTFGQIASPFIFTKDVVAHKTTFAQIDLPVTFIKEIVASKETFGLIEFPIDMNFSVVAEVQGIRFGATSMSLIFGKEIIATKETFGQIESPYIFIPTVDAKRTTFGQITSLPDPLGDPDEPGLSALVFGKETSGQRETFGQLTFPINASFIVSGSGFQTHYGELSMGLVFDEQTIGQRKTFGQFSTPYLFAATSEATKTTFGKIESPVDFIIDVETGKVEAFSQIAFEILLGLETAGFMRPEIIILNLAKAIYLGSTPVDAVYTDSQKVWPE